MPTGDLLTSFVEAMTEIGTPPCASCEFARRDCRGWRACAAFAQWTETGEAVGDRTPTIEHFAGLFPGLVPVNVLRRYWRKASARITAAVNRGEIASLTVAERRARHRERRTLIWKVDPAKREAFLAQKRASQLRLSREQGRRPMTSERAAARSRLIWVGRRAKAAPQMTREELVAEMARLQISVEDLAFELDVEVGTVRAWLRPVPRRVSDRAARWLRSPSPRRRSRKSVSHRPGYMSPTEFREAMAITGMRAEEVAANAGVPVQRVKKWRYDARSRPSKRVVEWLRALAAIRQEAIATQIVSRPRGKNQRRRPEEASGADWRGPVAATPAPESFRDAHPATHGVAVPITPPSDPKPPAAA